MTRDVISPMIVCMTSNRYDLTHDEQLRVLQCARAYHADDYIAYVNALGVLCVVCDLDNDDTRDGFMWVDSMWIEFDPVDVDELDNDFRITL